MIASLEKLERIPEHAPHFDAQWLQLNRLLAEGAADSPLRKALRRLPTRLAIRLMDQLFVPGMVRHYLFRKRLLQQQTERAVANGTTQVIVLGGGFDTLAWRLARRFPTVGFFEIDLPETQAAKLALLHDAGAPPGNCTYLPADLSTTDLEVVLSHAPGFDATACTLVIIEGVLMYLPPAAVKALFTTIRTLLQGALEVTFGATSCSDDAGGCRCA